MGGTEEQTGVVIVTPFGHNGHVSREQPGLTICKKNVTARGFTGRVVHFVGVSSFVQWLASESEKQTITDICWQLSERLRNTGSSSTPTLLFRNSLPALCSPNKHHSHCATEMHWLLDWSGSAKMQTGRHMIVLYYTGFCFVFKISQ